VASLCRASDHSSNRLRAGRGVPITRADMRPLVLIACFLFLGFMALFHVDGVPHAYAALAAAGSLLLSLR
jgi:hypothetical protein